MKQRQRLNDGRSEGEGLGREKQDKRREQHGGSFYLVSSLKFIHFRA